MMKGCALASFPFSPFGFSSSFLLDPVPNLIRLSQIGIPEPLALCLHLVLESIESRDKLVSS